MTMWWVLAGRLWLLVCCVTAAACDTLPKGTQSGKVHEVTIEEGSVVPLDLEVAIGDEIRFKNERLKPSYVFFFRDFMDELSCQRGFAFFWGTEEEAKIYPGESASLCFARTGSVGFTVQDEPTEIGGIGGTPGLTKVPHARAGVIIVK